MAQGMFDFREYSNPVPDGASVYASSSASGSYYANVYANRTVYPGSKSPGVIEKVL